jgi:hypothetical protein
MLLGKGHFFVQIIYFLFVQRSSKGATNHIVSDVFWEHEWRCSYKACTFHNLAILFFVAYPTSRLYFK